jgi:hypothetical protein
MVCRRFRSLPFIICAGMVASVVPWSPALASEASPAHDATVLVTVVRQLGQRQVTGYGTGFAIHPDGFLITRRSTVASTLMDDTGGEPKDVEAPVKRLSVIVHGGSPNRAELPARLVADDRRLDLALLKITHSFASPLSLSPSNTLQIADAVTIVGFRMTDADAQKTVVEPASELELRPWTGRGEVTGFRHTRTARGSVVQTGIEILPSHSGAPMLDASDRVIGVVVTNSKGVADAISLTALRTFVDASEFKVVMSPPGIYPDLDRMTVDIIPLLGDFERAIGTVCVEGRDLRPAYGRMEKTDFGFRAVIRTDDRMFGVIPPESYTATIEIQTPGAGARLKRRLRVPATDTQIAFEHSPEVYAVEPEPYVPGSDPGLTEYAGHLKSEGSSLADAGGDVEIQRSASGSVVIDQATISSFVGVPAEAFSELESDDDKALASRFEIVFGEFCTLTSEHMIPIPPRRDGMTEAQYRRLVDQYVAKIGAAGVASWAAHLSKIAGEADALYSKLRRKRIGKCQDGTWRTSEPGCPTPGPDSCS